MCRRADIHRRVCGAAQPVKGSVLPIGARGDHGGLQRLACTRRRLLAAARAVEHYEISRYGTLKTWANELGLGDAVRLLEQTLAEEKKTDATLTEIAESAVNRHAGSRLNS
jgi:hypothetical protein